MTIPARGHPANYIGWCPFCGHSWWGCPGHADDDDDEPIDEKRLEREHTVLTNVRDRFSDQT